MKVLVILGSLRKKNTYHAVQAFESLHKQHRDDCEYEYLFLHEQNLELCRGCFLCLSKGEAFCPLDDNLQEIIHKMESADVIILASPNYVMNVNWLTKNFIDRTAYCLHRPRFFDTRFILLVTSGNFMGAKKARAALSALVSGGKIVGRLMLYTAPELSQKKKLRQEKKFRQTSIKIIKELDKPYTHKASMATLMWFSPFKATQEASKDSLPADYAYYEDKDYFTDTQLSGWQKGTVRIVSSLIRRFMH